MDIHGAFKDTDDSSSNGEENNQHHQQHLQQPSKLNSGVGVVDDFSLGEEEDEDSLTLDGGNHPPSSSSRHAAQQQRHHRRGGGRNSMNNKKGMEYQTKQERILRSMGIPEDYLIDPLNAEPVLEHLQKRVDRNNNNNNNNNKKKQQDGTNTTNTSNNETLSMMENVMANRIPLEELLQAADMDIQLHRRRVRAVLTKDTSGLLKSSSGGDGLESGDEDDEWMNNDPHVIARKERKEALTLLREELSREADGIISDFTSEDQRDARNNTIHDLVHDRLERFKGALELFVHQDLEDTPIIGESSGSSSGLDCLTLIESLCRGWRKSTTTTDGGEGMMNVVLLTPEEEGHLLQHASHVCQTMLEQTAQNVRDAKEEAAETEDAYHVQLEAHAIAAKQLVQVARNIEDSYVLNGKEALRIGHSLEMAERQRRSCESASILLKRWWMMEQLAEQEKMTGELIQVQEEVRGVIPSSSCRLDPLYTRPENSLDGAKALLDLRNVLSSRSNASTSSTTAATANDPSTASSSDHWNAAKRFDLVGNLVRRTSVALEARLLNQFSQIYSTGGTYDFTSVDACGRPGRLNWIHLRDLAEALLCFDNGKSLYRRYVGLVVTTKFPELFHSQQDRQITAATTANPDNDHPDSNNHHDHHHDSKATTTTHDNDDTTTNTKGLRKPPMLHSRQSSMDTVDSDADTNHHHHHEGEDLDIDMTRSQLSNLFHRVCSVCTAEFQLMAHVFSIGEQSWGDSVYPVARALLQRIISDPVSGLQARINELLASIDGNANGNRVTNGAKKLDTFVVFHEKAAGLFSLLKEAAEHMLDYSPALEQLRPTTTSSVPLNDGNPTEEMMDDDDTNFDKTNHDPSSTPHNNNNNNNNNNNHHQPASNVRAVQSLMQFLSAQEIALGNGHRRGYLNLELRLLHHDCCSCIEQTGVRLILPSKHPTNHGGKTPSHNNALTSSSSNDHPTITTSDMAEYRAPTLQMDKESLKRLGFDGILEGPLRSNVLRQPLIQSTDSLARARLMFGGASISTSSFSMAGQTDSAGNSDDDPTAKVVWTIYSQVCNFYGETYLYPITETLGNMLSPKAPSTPPVLFTNDHHHHHHGDSHHSTKVHDLGVPSHFWKCLDHVHLAARSFDKELWAYHRQGSGRVWEILTQTGSVATLSLASNRRLQFFTQLEALGEVALLQALDTLSTHIQWMLVMGGELSVRKEGTTGRLLHGLTGPGSGGPYAIPASSSLNPNCSPAVDSLQRCLREQFVYINVALTPQSLSRFWTALSMRLYDILVTRLLQHYTVSLNGAVILNKDVEALQYAASLAGTDHSHWGRLRELLSVFMTPPDALKTILVGAEGDINSGKGLFATIGREESLVFMSRRADFKYKTNQGLKKSVWVTDLLHDLGVKDPTDSPINIARYAAERKHQK